MKAPASIHSKHSWMSGAFFRCRLEQFRAVPCYLADRGRCSWQTRAKASDYIQWVIAYIT